LAGYVGYAMSDLDSNSQDTAMWKTEVPISLGRVARFTQPNAKASLYFEFWVITFPVIFEDNTAKDHYPI